MSGEKPSAVPSPDASKADVPTPAATGSAPAGAKDELPDVTTARENFRKTAGEFLAKLKKFDANLPDDMKMFLDDRLTKNDGPIAKLRKLADGTQPSPSNNEVIASMEALRNMQEKRRINAQMASLEHGGKLNEKEIIQEKDELDGVIKKAEGEESKYQKAVKKENAAPSESSPTFIERDGHKLLVAGGGVQATNSSMPSFEAALAEFKGPKNERAFTNVKLIGPPVNAELANKSRAYLKDVVNRLEATMKAGLMPASDLQTITTVLSQSMNETPTSRFIERSQNQAMIDRLDKAVEQYKKDATEFKAGKKKENAGVNVEAKTEKVENKDKASLTIKDVTKDTPVITSPKPGGP